MTYIFDGYNYFIRLEKGEKLSQAFEDFAKQTNIEGGWLSGLGGALQMTLGFYDLNKKQYQWRDFKDLYEVISLQGNISLDEDKKPTMHLHGTFSGSDYRAIGGHVKDLVAAATLEIFVHRSFKPLHRKHNQEVGLKLLDLDGERS